MIRRVTGSVAHVVSCANSDIVSCPDPIPREGWDLGTMSDTLTIKNILTATKGSLNEKREFHASTESCDWYC